MNEIQAVILHLIDVGVPHLGEEAEGRWGVWIIYRELDSSLGHRTGQILCLHAAVDCHQYNRIDFY